MVFPRNRPSERLHGLYRKGFSYFNVPDFHRRPLLESRVPPLRLNQSLDDIISGIIHLLGGDVQVTKQDTTLPPTSTKQSPKPTRINNRGPAHFYERKPPIKPSSVVTESTTSTSEGKPSRWTFPGDKDVSLILGLLNDTSSDTSETITSTDNGVSSFSISSSSFSSNLTGLVEVSPTFTSSYFFETTADISLDIKTSTTETPKPVDSLIEIQPSVTVFTQEMPSLVETQITTSSGTTPVLESSVIPSSTERTSVETTTYLSVPSGPVTDWLPVLKPDFNVVFSANKNKEPVIITQPTAFEMTVTQQMAHGRPSDHQTSSDVLSVFPTTTAYTTSSIKNITTKTMPTTSDDPSLTIISTQVDVVYGRPSITVQPSIEHPGRPHVFAVDISQVRPSKPPGMRPRPRPLPVPVRGNGPRPISATRPPVSPPRKPSSYRPAVVDVPEVRIDTCLVGDDSTCDVQLNEHCRTERGVSSCLCRPGFGRAEQRGLCTPVVSMILTLKVAKIGDRSIDPSLLIPASQDYKRLFLEASQAMSTVFSYSPMAQAFRGATVNRVWFVANRMVINSTVHLAESEVRGSLRHHVEHAVASAINRQRNRVGESQLYVYGPLSALVEVEDLNECGSNELNDCSEFALCENLFGTFQCSCAPGYTDKSSPGARTTGRICSACAPDYCNGRGKCIVVNGKQECKCKSNFGGARCQVDNEVVGVSVGVSLVAVIVIVITAACLYIWNRRWKQAQEKTDAAKHLGYRLQTLADHVRWGAGATPLGSNTYVPSDSTMRLTPSQMTSSASQLYSMPTLPMASTRQERRLAYEDDLNPYGRIIRTLQKSNTCQKESNGMHYDTLSSECASSEELGFPSVPSNSFVYHGSFPHRQPYR